MLVIHGNWNSLSLVWLLYFGQNFQSFSQRLTTAEKTWDEEMKPFRGRKVVSYHRSWPNFAKRFGLDVDTVARGQRELLSGQVLRGRVRQAGGGRPAVEKKRPKS